MCGGALDSPQYMRVRARHDYCAPGHPRLYECVQIFPEENPVSQAWAQFRLTILAAIVLAVGVRDLFLRGRVLGSRGLAWLLPVACDLVNGD